MDRERAQEPLDHDVSSSLGKHARQIDVLLRLEQATNPRVQPTLVLANTH